MDLVWEYGRKWTENNEVQWYPGKSAKQVKAYIKTSIRVGTPYDGYGSSKRKEQVLVRRKVSETVEEEPFIDKPAPKMEFHISADPPIDPSQLWAALNYKTVEDAARARQDRRW